MSSRFPAVVVGLTPAFLLILALPSASAVTINGELGWSESAVIRGLLTASPGEIAYYVEHLPPNVRPAQQEWILTADKLWLFSSVHEETVTIGTNMQAQSTEAGTRDASEREDWNNATYEFENPSVLVQVQPTRHYGSTALLYSDAAEKAEFTVESSDASTIRVRSVDPAGDFFSVPASGDEEETEETSYRYPAPDGRFLAIRSGSRIASGGDLRGAFFGWTLIVSEPGQGEFRYETGIQRTHDPTTGLESGHRTEFVTIIATGAHFEANPTIGDVALYTPLARYDGEGAYPDGRYTGESQDLAPAHHDLLALDGSIWLGAVDRAANERDNHVRAWGNVAWEPPLALPAPALPTDASLTLLASSTLLIGGAQLLPQLGQALRGGLFAFYARLREQEPDANKTRTRIFELIRVEPGLNLSRIVDELMIGWGTAAYHVQILKRQGRVKELRFLNRVCFFSMAEGGESKQLQTVLLRQPNYRKVMHVLEGSPGLSQREVASLTGHARQYISRLVAKMERAGLLRAEPSPTGRRYYPLPGLAGNGNGHELPNGNGHTNGNGQESMAPVPAPSAPLPPPPSL